MFGGPGENAAPARWGAADEDARLLITMLLERIIASGVALAVA